MAGIENISNHSRLSATNATNSSNTLKSDSTDVYGLDMSDFLALMVAQFTNQTMDSTADTSEMLNQMVQMQMVTALANVTSALETVTDHSIMSYAASLVGKEVTVAGYDENNQYSEIVGTVSATGSYGGEQVIFINGEMFYMTQIIAVGRLPEVNSGSTTPDAGGDVNNGVTDSGAVGGSGNATEGAENSGAVEGGTSSGNVTGSDITGSDITDNVANSGATESSGNDTTADTDAAESEESDAAEESGGEN